jgi:hypothetical protein
MTKLSLLYIPYEVEESLCALLSIDDAVVAQAAVVAAMEAELLAPLTADRQSDNC